MLDALGNIGDFVGGVAVVVTLAYLAVQVRQHNAGLRTASRQGLSTGYRVHNGARRFYNAPLVASDHARLAEGGLPDVLELGFFRLHA